MQFLNASPKVVQKYIHDVPTSRKDTVKVFIEMIDLLQTHYTEEEFSILLKHILFITQDQIDELKFDDDQFKTIMDFYLKDHDALNIEEEIVGHYTGYEHDF